MAIRFDSTDGRFVHLDAVAYESDLNNWPPDSWLMIELDAFDGRSDWHRLSSSFETADLERLARDLRVVVEGGPRRLDWGATELDFELRIEHAAIENQHRVTVRLNCHFHRDFAGEPCYQEWLELPFLLSDEDLLRLADDTDDVALRFPARKE